MSVELDRLHACKAAIRNPNTFPGGYTVGIYLETGDRICPSCARKCWPDIVGATLRHPTKGYHGWAVIRVDVHWEGDPESCCECGAELVSEYGPVPNDSDAIVSCDGCRYSAALEGKHLGTFADADAAWSAVRDAAGPDYFPRCWFVDDHGGFTLTDDHGNHLRS